MLKKIIAAFLSIALISSAGIRAYAADNTNEDTDIVSLAEQGAALRKSLGFKAGDIWYFGDMVSVSDRYGNTEWFNMGTRLYLIDTDDVKQRVRVYKSNHKDKYVHYLSYSDFEAASGSFLESNNGFILGDLNYDYIVDFYDLVFLRKDLLGSNKNDKFSVLHDINADDDVNVADLVSLQKWLLGENKYMSNDYGAEDGFKEIREQIEHLVPEYNKLANALRSEDYYDKSSKIEYYSSSGKHAVFAPYNHTDYDSPDMIEADIKRLFTQSFIDENIMRTTDIGTIWSNKDFGEYPDGYRWSDDTPIADTPFPYLFIYRNGKLYKNVEKEELFESTLLNYIMIPYYPENANCGIDLDFGGFKDNSIKASLTAYESNFGLREYEFEYHLDDDIWKINKTNVILRT